MNDYVSLFNEIIAPYSHTELEQACKVLNRIYNIYDSDDFRWTQLKYVLFRSSTSAFDLLKKTQISNRIVNDLFFKYYPCERVIKYYLINHLRNISNHIVAFEMSIGTSRIDICRVNGSSYAYEIKTQYDSFDRLSSQMSDYTECFEHVYLVVPLSRKREALKHLPSSCGLITYRIENQTCHFSYPRRANKNTCNVKKCLKSLSSADLTTLLRLLHTPIRSTLKQQKLDTLWTFSERTIYSAYKNLLKIKYQDKWDFVIMHFDEILPIDVQNFFSTSINPTLTYYSPQKKGISPKG